MITTAAHEINGGRPPHLEPQSGQDHDFFFIDRPSPERALETVVEVVAERVPKRFDMDPIRDVQVLAPMYQGRGRDRRPQRAPPGSGSTRTDRRP